MDAPFHPDHLQVTGTRLYASTVGARFVVFALDTGARLWSRGDKTFDLYTEPAVAAGLIVVGASAGYPSKGRVFAFDEATGRIRWKSEWMDFITGAPVVQDDHVFVGSHDGKLRALDRRSGKPRWALPTGGPVYSTPLVAGDRVVFGSGDGLVRAVRIADGRLLWSYRTGGEVASRPAMDGDRIYVGSLDRRLHAIDRTRGTGLWTYEAGSYVTNPKVDSGTVYVGTMGGDVLSLDGVTGELRWRAGLKCGSCDDMDGFGDVEVSAERVVAVSRKGTVYSLDRRSGNVQWSLEADGGRMATARVSGRIVYVSSGTDVRRFDLSSGALLDAQRP